MGVLDMHRTSLVILGVLAVTGCATGTYHVVEYPQREADLYPLSQTVDGLSVAIDEVRSGQRVDRYFGADLTRRDILPVAVVVSNNSTHRVTITPADVLLHKGSDVIDPLPIQEVIEVARDEHALMSSSETDVARYFDSLALKETVLQPGESYRGVLFFLLPRPKKKDENYSFLPLFNPSSLQVVVGARDMDTRERYHFGPFSLASLKDAPY